MAKVNPFLSMIALNINELRHRVAEWIIKQDPSICYLQETLYIKGHT